MRLASLVLFAVLAVASGAEAQLKQKHTYWITTHVEGQAPEVFRAQQLTAAIQQKLKVTYGDAIDVREWDGTGCPSLPDPDACDVVSLVHDAGAFPLLVEQLKQTIKHGRVRELGDFKCSNRPLVDCWKDAVRDSAAVVQRHHRVHLTSVDK